LLLFVTRRFRFPNPRRGLRFDAKESLAGMLWERHQASDGPTGCSTSSLPSDGHRNGVSGEEKKSAFGVPLPQPYFLTQEKDPRIPDPVARDSGDGLAKLSFFGTKQEVGYL
jgi:hypothetical protein